MKNVASSHDGVSQNLFLWELKQQDLYSQMFDIYKLAAMLLCKFEGNQVNDDDDFNLGHNP